MLNALRVDEVKCFLKKNGIDWLTENEVQLYANFCEAVSFGISGKLTTEETMSAMDWLSDLLQDKKLDFQIHVPKEERISAQIRAMETLDFVQGKLTKEEKVFFAFCVYWITCTFFYNEETDGYFNGLADFTSPEAILPIYEMEKENNPWLFDFEKSGKTGRFGYDITNPIPVVSIREEYRYMKRLRYPGGSVVYRRKGSVMTDIGILDRYIVRVLFNGEDSTNYKEYTIFIDPYDFMNSEIAPDGFVLSRAVETK